MSLRVTKVAKRTSLTPGRSLDYSRHIVSSSTTLMRPYTGNLSSYLSRISKKLYRPLKAPICTVNPKFGFSWPKTMDFRAQSPHEPLSAQPLICLFLNSLNQLSQTCKGSFYYNIYYARSSNFLKKP